VVVTSVRADIIVPDIVIPNAFTPNGDGINDVLTVLIDSRIRIKYFKVYNRWGQQVYETSDINNFWNGYRGSSNPLPGVYYWVLEGDENSRKYLRRGSVTVIR
jgi:gliding motility-associated-like protein